MFTNQNSTDKNSYFMNLALMQAHKSLGNTKIEIDIYLDITLRQLVMYTKNEISAI